MRNLRRPVRPSVLVRWLSAPLLAVLAGCAAPVPGGIANPGPAPLPAPPVTAGLLARHDAARPAAEPIDDVAALYREARSDLKAGRPDAAIARLRRVREIDPQQIEAANVLAVLLAEAGDFDGARTELQAVLAVRPNDPFARANYAVIGTEPVAAVTTGPAQPAGTDPDAALAAGKPPVATMTEGHVVATRPAMPTGMSSAAASPSGTDSRVTDGITRIELHNASRHAGLAVRLSKRLTPELASALTLRTGNWSRFNLLRTEIHHRPGDAAQAKRIARLLGLPLSALRASTTVPEDADLRIILGHDGGQLADVPRPRVSARSART